MIHGNRLRIGKRTSFNRSWLEIVTRCEFLLIDVCITLRLERSKMCDEVFGIIESLVWCNCIDSRVMKSILYVTDPVVGFRPEWGWWMFVCRACHCRLSSCIAFYYTIGLTRVHSSRQVHETHFRPVCLQTHIDELAWLVRTERSLLSVGLWICVFTEHVYEATCLRDRKSVV